MCVLRALCCSSSELCSARERRLGVCVCQSHKWKGGAGGWWCNCTVCHLIVICCLQIVKEVCNIHLLQWLTNVCLTPVPWLSLYMWPILFCARQSTLQASQHNHPGLVQHVQGCCRWTTYIPASWYGSVQPLDAPSSGLVPCLTGEVSGKIFSNPVFSDPLAGDTEDYWTHVLMYSTCKVIHAYSTTELWKGPAQWPRRTKRSVTVSLHQVGGKQLTPWHNVTEMLHRQGTHR